MSYTYQAPKDFEAQGAKLQRDFKDEDALVKAGGYSVQPKYDGVFSVAHTSQGRSESRQGELQPSAQHLLDTALKVFGVNHLVFMELWIPGTSHKAINGASRRQELQPQLQGRVFDMISVFDFVEGKCSTPYEDRIGVLRQKLADVEELRAVQDVTVAPGLTMVEAARVYQKDPNDAYDGLILRRNDAIWLPGASKKGEVVKVKPAITLDLRVVGQEVEEKPTKLGGKLLVTYKNVITKVGSGLDQDTLKAMLEGRKDFTGSVVEVSTLGVTEAGKLREPRFERERFDTLPEEEKGS